MLVYMIPLGMSYATTARMGQWFGRRDLTGLKRAGYVSGSIILGTTVVVAISIYTVYAYSPKLKERAYLFGDRILTFWNNALQLRRIERSGRCMCEDKEASRARQTTEVAIPGETLSPPQREQLTLSF